MGEDLMVPEVVEHQELILQLIAVDFIMAE